MRRGRISMKGGEQSLKRVEWGIENDITDTKT